LCHLAVKKHFLTDHEKTDVDAFRTIHVRPKVCAPAGERVEERKMSSSFLSFPNIQNSRRPTKMDGGNIEEERKREKIVERKTWFAKKIMKGRKEEEEKGKERIWQKD
jgi:hypothetical protein